MWSTALIECGHSQIVGFLQKLCLIAVSFVAQRALTEEERHLHLGGSCRRQAHIAFGQGARGVRLGKHSAVDLLILQHEQTNSVTVDLCVEEIVAFQTQTVAQTRNIVVGIGETCHAHGASFEVAEFANAQPTAGHQRPTSIEREKMVEIAHLTARTIVGCAILVGDSAVHRAAEECGVRIKLGKVRFHAQR